MTNISANPKPLCSVVNHCIINRTDETFNATMVQEKEIVKEVEGKVDVTFKATEGNTRRSNQNFNTNNSTLVLSSSSPWNTHGPRGQGSQVPPDGPYCLAPQ